ncbi:EcsC family protein [Deinococcus cellulosilyticus]|uniref:EcsC family protein n=1 Tax=Deinococcus cellulosilyticus (strain DSM 18568 / NBRC 106333 / KACC 11606 / 5516J-15) TaxID=1223518 RepID=A0A511MWV9_DEIC1|nr:EcsC family protein [Deinococcus cellulosilyticus]GEM45065.1 hypothetical protein DC3_07000 [Deinococcus cellulosilyticus NBRC 106333 = KACC 11606]
MPQDHPNEPVNPEVQGTEEASTDLMLYEKAQDARLYHQKARDDIDRWASARPSALEKTGKKTALLIERSLGSLGKYIPESMTERVTGAVEQALESTAHLADRLLDEEKIEKSVQETRKSIPCELQARDAVARKIILENLSVGTVSGAAAGAGGWATILLDVPVLITVTQRVIRQVAAAYGYRVDTPEEQAIARGILGSASALDVGQREKFIFSMHAVSRALRQGAGLDKVVSILLPATLEKLGVREIAKSIGINLTQRKALQLVPLVGAAVGGTMNALTIKDTATAAFMVYRKRWLEEHTDVYDGMQTPEEEVIEAVAVDEPA